MIRKKQRNEDRDREKKENKETITKSKGCFTCATPKRRLLRQNSRGATEGASVDGEPLPVSISQEVSWRAFPRSTDADAAAAAMSIRWSLLSLCYIGLTTSSVSWNVPLDQGRAESYQVKNFRVRYIFRFRRYCRRRRGGVGGSDVMERRHGLAVANRAGEEIAGRSPVSLPFSFKFTCDSEGGFYA